MLTFLRKFRKSLIESGSGQKYFIYAIGEIALVVIGILVALQINNWNEWKKEREKEKEVLHDIMNNLIRNNEIIHTSLALIDDFDKSSEIVLSAIRNKAPYSDTLNAHFFQSTRAGGLLFPLSTEGYESYKNAGFDIIQSEILKDQTLELYEVSYKSIKEKTQWTMDKAIQCDVYFHSLFTSDSRDEYIPINYEELLADQRYKGFLITVKDNLRNWVVEHVIVSLEKGEHLVQLIQEELGETEE